MELQFAGFFRCGEVGGVMDILALFRFVCEDLLLADCDNLGMVGDRVSSADSFCFAVSDRVTEIILVKFGGEDILFV